MNKDFIKYEVSIKDEPFFIADEKISNKTAVLTLYFPDDKQDIENLGYFSSSDISEILKEKFIDLDSVFIDELPPISGTIKNIILTNSFIVSSQISVNCIITGICNFNKTFFNAEKIDFSKTVFNYQANFADTCYKSENITFNDCIFENGLIHKNSKFECDIKKFDKILVKKGEFNFANTEFGDGNISFQDAKLGVERKTFTMSRFGKGFKDFTRTKFGNGDIFFERVKFGDGNISFRSADFGDGAVDFRRAEFGDGEKNFMHSNFGNGTVKFVNSIFKSGKITFRLADFGVGDVDFHYTNFGTTDIFFERTIFSKGSLDFRGVEAKNTRLNFNHIKFDDGDFIFESLEITDGVVFLKNSVFGRGFINFENSRCTNTKMHIENVDFGYGSVSFNNAEFEEIRFKGSQINSYFDFRLKKCQILDLSNTVINDVLDLSPPDEGVHVKTLYLQGVRLLGRIYLDWDRSNVKELIHNQDVTNYEKSEQFRILKENYRNMGLYEFEDLAYIEFKRAQGKAKYEEIKKYKTSKRLKASILYQLEVLIFDKMGNYATNPVRVLKSMGIAYFVFSLIYLALEYLFPNRALILSSLFAPDSPNVMGKVGKAFYHSAITFLTIGYGDYYPVGIIRILSSVEGFIGLFLMSYFTVAFVRKILR